MPRKQHTLSDLTASRKQNGDVTRSVTEVRGHLTCSALSAHACSASRSATLSLSVSLRQVRQAQSEAFSHSPSSSLLHAAASGIQYIMIKLASYHDCEEHRCFRMMSVTVADVKTQVSLAERLQVARSVAADPLQRNTQAINAQNPN